MVALVILVVGLALYLVMAYTSTVDLIMGEMVKAFTSHLHLKLTLFLS